MSTIAPFPADSRPLLEVRQLTQVYKLRRQKLFAPRPLLRDATATLWRPGGAP
jgi:peptide/nickel transport system ATP-binding protein